MSTHKNQQAKPAAQPATKEHKHAPLPFVFTRMNYILTGLSLVVLIIGFVAMSGSKGDIYDFRRITLAPIIVMLGFLIGFVAIFYKEKQNDHNSSEPQ